MYQQNRLRPRRLALVRDKEWMPMAEAAAAAGVDRWAGRVRAYADSMQMLQPLSDTLLLCGRECMHIHAHPVLLRLHRRIGS